MTRHMIAAWLLCVLVAVALAPSYAEALSPLKQLESGVPPEEVQWRYGLVLVVRGADDAVCVREETAAKKGWDVTAPAATGVPHPITHKEGPKTVAAQEHAGIVAANNAFALDFYRHISAGDKNVFLSPTSIYAVFSIRYEGAVGVMAAQMERAFGFEPDDVRRHSDTALMMASLNRDDPHATLSVTNAEWMYWVDAHDPHLNTVRNVYHASVEEVDFTTAGHDKQASADRINMWASDNTNGKIKQVIGPTDVDLDTVSLITNAVYFEGSWAVPFPENNTKRSDFYRNDTDVISVDFMNMHGMFDYLHADGVQVLKLPYRGDRLSMTVILPDDALGTRQLDDTVSIERIEQLVGNLKSSQVKVSMPKFEAETKYDLKDHLMAVGVHDAHSDSDDPYSVGHTAGGLRVDESAHDAYVTTVYESLFVASPDHLGKAAHNAYVAAGWGATGTAAADILASTELERLQYPHFNADHPFIFLIRDDWSGAILFLGKIADPS